MSRPAAPQAPDVRDIDDIEALRKELALQARDTLLQLGFVLLEAQVLTTEPSELEKTRAKGEGAAGHLDVVARRSNGISAEGGLR